VDGIHQIQDRGQWWALVNTIMNIVLRERLDIAWLAEHLRY
jgi:hypothetical protein